MDENLLFYIFWKKSDETFPLLEHVFQLIAVDCAVKRRTPVFHFLLFSRSW